MEILVVDGSSLISLLATEIGHVLSPEWWHTHSVALLHVLMIDLTLGDTRLVGTIGERWGEEGEEGVEGVRNFRRAK